MRRSATLTLICCLLGTVETEAASPAGAAQAVQAAEARERRLRQDPERLRFRHHILGLVRSWKRARAAARNSELEPKAAEGVVRSLELLAHWSGREEDAARARRARGQWRQSHGVPAPSPDLERAEAAAPAPQVPAPVPDEPLPPEPRASAIPTPLPVPSPGRPSRATPADRGRPLDALGIRTVVIDPGHGGTEHGARSARGLLEKDVNLAIARALKAELESDFHVLLTRDRDRTLSLAERVRMANRAEADLFVSIHANGHTQSRFHGIETYVLATDSPRYPRRLARREHHHHHAVEVTEDPHLRQDVRLLLADLAMRSAADQGRQLAERVQAHLVQGLRAKHPEVVDLGVKEALFFVLLGPRMPSVLVETGFLTHAEEAQRLARPAYRRRVAEGIARGIRSYAGGRAQWARSEPRSATDAYVALP